MRVGIQFGRAAAFLPPLVFSVMANGMTKEEATVRAAYASVVLASRVQAAMDSGGKSDAAGLSIGIKDVRGGPISELLDKVVSDWVTVPSGDVLQCTPGTWNFRPATGEEQHIGTTVNVSNWAPATQVYGEYGRRPEEWNVTFGHIFQEMGWHPVSWVSFTVSLSAHSLERQYKAMFLFDPGASNAADQVRVIDYVLNAPVLTTLLHSSVAEDIAALPSRTRGAGPKRLLESTRATGECVTDSVTRLCCDPATLQCGVKPQRAAQ
jgi:hypothetical protein